MTDVPSYRAPMRSRLDAVAPGAGTGRGLARGLCGIGGRLDRSPLDLAEAVEATAQTYGERSAARLRRFADVPDGAAVWTRDPDGRYFRGTLGGPWHYDGSSAAYEADLVHVRPCRWAEVEPPAVPEQVLEAFARGGRNFQRIRTLDATQV